MKVLARREALADLKDFQPNDGRGGDGGVEAIWLLPDGSKIGYQSKFFGNLEEAQWRQMDASVSQALATHPQLIKYVIALPFDLTPDRGPNARGKSQQGKWDEHVVKWKAEARNQSIALDFELWGATTLTDKLMQDGNGSLRTHWFGEQVMDNQWFKKQVSTAALKLDDRFNPDDHVEVSVESLFDAIVRGPSTQSKLNDAIDGLLKNRVPNIEFTTTEIVPDQAKLQTMQADWDILTLAKPKVQLSPSARWEWNELSEIANRLQDSASEVLRPFYSIEKETQSAAERQKLEGVTKALRDLSSAAYGVTSLFNGKGLVAELKQCALVLGEAGSGKSHVFGQVASLRVEQGLPTILILGQDIGEAPFWSQLNQVLGLSGNAIDEVLGTLNAVGERLGTRVLILFDAINEGAGAKYWKHWLPEVVKAVQSYPFLAAIFSCRDVYSKYAIPQDLYDDLPKYEIQGFSTPEEMERAAIQYLDKKGISRPNTLWLSPEFSNPLFLKSTSEALAAKGQTEFPRGLHGVSQLMALYLDSFSARTGVDSLTSNELSTPLKELVRKIALKMAENSQDYVTIGYANEIVAKCIGPRSAPQGKTWLEVFIQTNLFRRDPPPYSSSHDPLDPVNELVRFSFQRFQDFLMADALVDKVFAEKEKMVVSKRVGLFERLWQTLGLKKGTSRKPKVGDEFLKPGPMSFLFFDDDISHGVRYRFSGLVAALSTIYPERLGVEFVMSIPDWERHWDNDHVFHPAFAESFKWRRLDAFSDDTRDLLNRLNSDWVKDLSLLLEVSITVGHPYNAKRLHEHLMQYSLAERDSHWTQWINHSSREDLSQIDRIVSWSLSSVDEKTDPQHIELAAIFLSWSLSSSHMTLRDRATKALTSLFLRHSGAFEVVLENMKDCNDPFIVERLYAAAFGACCIDPMSDRLSRYSQLVFDAVFASGEPPVALLTRDYALGIVELANFRGATSPSVDLSKCYHPFSSSPPEFDLTEDEVKEIANASGDESILRSAGSEWGDYGKYIIPGRVRGFLTKPLSGPAPKSKDELKRICYEEVVAGRQDRIEALEAYEKSTHFLDPIILLIAEPRGVTEALEEDRNEVAEQLSTLRNDFEKLLMDAERQRMSGEYFRDGMSHDDYERVSIQQCRWWITKRAYELGWTKDLFPRDAHDSGYSRHQNDLERIGKKYQRIALDELQARLADNFWSLQGWGSGPSVYRHSHHEFRRGLEPTILPNNPCLSQDQSDEDAWILEPKIKLPVVPQEELRDWPTRSNPGATAVDIVGRHSPDGRRWVVLYDHVHDSDSYEDSSRRGHGLRREEFRFFQCVLVPSGKSERLATSLQEQQEIDVWNFKPVEYVDGPFLGEAFWRDTWVSTKLSDDIWKHQTIAIPVAYYQWESHLDKTLPNGLSTYLPQRWFAEELGLVNRSEDFCSWHRASGDEVFKVFRSGEDHQAGVVIEAEAFDDYLAAQDLEAVWLFIAERSAWPNGDDELARRPRSEAVIWRDGKNWKSFNWVRDT